MPDAPRVLVTGFEPFPGAPVNPTEWLVERLRREPPAADGIGAFRAEILPVSYSAVGERLSDIGRTFRPDIAIHFGLAKHCRGFRLERVARNRFVSPRADNDGFVPEAGPICAGREILPSALPLDAIHEALSAANMPVEWSDDAGGYLCNTVFTLSVAHGAPGFSPRMSGFIHVPPVKAEADGDPAWVFDEAVLLAGAGLIVRCCVAAWTSRT